MTLIEVLLATLVAMLVIAVVFSAYHTASVTLQGQQERKDGPESVALALRQMTRDLACMYINSEDAACDFKLLDRATQPSDTPFLAFCTAVPSPERDTRWLTLEEVEYSVAPEDERGDALYRISRPLAGVGSAAPVTNRLARDITAIDVLVYDGEEWKAEWEGGSGAPRAARIQIASGGKKLSAEAFIPVGSVITSDVERVSAPQ